MNHQDWEVRILKKNASQLKKDKQKKDKSKSVHNETARKLCKLDEATESQKVEKVSHSLKTQIMKARNEKKMTQKEFAQKLGVNVKVVQSYENGTAIPDNKILNKMRTVLGTKLVK